VEKLLEVNKVLHVVVVVVVFVVIITFMWGIYIYIPATSHLSGQYGYCSWHLCLYISTFHSMCVVPNMAVFCSSLILCFPICCSGIL
jgi:hypothetical protein